MGKQNKKLYGLRFLALPQSNHVILLKSLLSRVYFFFQKLTTCHLLRAYDETIINMNILLDSFFLKLFINLC